MSVPLTTLDALLANESRIIDVAVIDVEGAEADVLSGFDLARFRPRLLFIEENDVGIQQHMSAYPYTDVGLFETNRVYIRSDETEMLERLKRKRL